MSSESLKSLCIHSIGGGWGQEVSDEKHTERVAIIRGTDIPRVAFGNFSSVPHRWETASKVKNRLLQVGDIVIEVAGGSAASGQHTGRSLFVTENIIKKLGGRVIPASFCRLLRLDKNNVDAKYITYQIAGMHLSGEIAEFENQSTGIANFQFTRFLQEIYPLTSDVENQKEISSLLSEIDDCITELRETNKTLEAIAQAIFKSWFVDFDPVRAKMEGRVPTGMDEATAALFPDSFEESELGIVPKGWRAVPFGELITQTIGGDWGTDSPSDSNDVRVAIIRGTDIPDFQLGAASRVPIRYTSSKKLSTRKLVGGDIVLEVSGGSTDQPTGRALYVTNDLLEQFDCPVEPASFCRLLRPQSKYIGVLLAQHLTYIYAQGKTWEYQYQSTGIANFQTTHFLATEMVIMPSQEVLECFSKLVSSVANRSHLSEIKELSIMRDTLLPRLISAQLQMAA